MNSAHRSLLVMAAVATSMAFPLTDAQAGSGNELYLLQESSPVATRGNSLLVDQSAASNSLVIGPARSVSDELEVFRSERTGDFQGTNLVTLAPRESGGVPPATQRGDGNVATLTITGDGGQIQFLQEGGQAGSGNTATVVAASAATAALIQSGDSNAASLDVGVGASGLVAQFGSNLTTNLNVGSGGAGQVIQIGNNSTTGDVTVDPGTTLTYTQTGNNLAPIGNTGVTVNSFTATGAVTINQSAF